MGKETAPTHSPIDGFDIRPATLDDIPALVRHRCGMFHDMGQLRDEARDALAEASARYYAEAMPSGEYVAWVVAPRDQPDLIVAGGGVQLRRILPRTDREGNLQRPGPQGLIVNVYTEPQYRRRGLAELVMRTIIEWASQNGVASMVLHASEMGRSLYEKMGWVASNEMYFPLRG
jgi:GNAT superfamily N-acetyltransferase